MEAVIGLVMLGMYFLPLIVAALRHHNVGGVAIVNVLTGWTILGWIIALVMACGNNKPQQVIIHHQNAEIPPPSH